MVKKGPKKKASNGVIAKASNGVTAKLVPAPEPIVAPAPPSFRSIKYEMEEEVRTFRDYAVKKYSNFQGHDLRKDLSWFMEQMGIGIASDMERAKREERQALIAANQAAEKLALEKQKLDEEKK
jgi:hypothetical protein